MNYRTLISLTIIICISHSSFGSSYSTLKGTLKDECGQNIDNVRVDIVSQTGFIKQLYTDADGKFKVDSLVSNVEYSLRFVKTKFFGNTADIMLNKDTLINIELQHIPYSITPFPIITFEYEEFEVTPNYRDSLVGFITVMKQNPTLVIGLVVYRDSSEIVDLSKKRGCSVMSLIISLGIDSNRLVIEKSNVRVGLFNLSSFPYRGKLFSDPFSSCGLPLFDME